MTFVSRQTVRSLWQAHSSKSLLALDVGTSFTGVAYAKFSQAPKVLCTLMSKPVEEFARSFEALVEEHDGVAVVVGWPGEKPENLGVCLCINDLVKKLQQSYGFTLPFCRVNERLSTVQAGSILYGLSLRKSRNLLNQTAAAVILERFVSEMSERSQSYHC
mmetsp:Transcript_25999/g.46007  ORF Transcript_25999/g.46007 Transcript_25999/m.46007 type:complete len:161 (+) Transcript_25999:31-513(+)